MISFQGNNRVPPRNTSYKRLFDILGALALLIVFSPLMLAIAVAVFVTGGGSVIYSHKRVGRSHRAFSCLKFRTMVKDADNVLQRILNEDPAARAEWKKHQKLKNDPRILPGIGGMLRRSSLDELPQLFNVLRGEMSLVGPRPVTEGELKNYGDALDLYLSVRPGLTGPWQIGDRSNTTFEVRVAQDVQYIRCGNLLTDLRILRATVSIILKGRAPGAY